MMISRKLFAFTLLISCMAFLCDSARSRSLLLTRLKRQETPKTADISNPVLDTITQFMERLTSGLAPNRQETALPSGDPLRDLDLSKIGLCDRITCTDIYKAIDDFRKSDLYLNLRGLFYLLQDDQGLQVLMSSLKDPETLKRLFRNERIFLKDPTSEVNVKIDGGNSNNLLPNLLLTDPNKISKSNNFYPTKTDDVYVESSALYPKQVTRHPVIGTTRGHVDYFDYYYNKG